MLHTFLTSAIDTGGRVHNQAALLPLKVNGTKWIGGWVGPKAKLAALAPPPPKNCLFRETNNDFLAVQPVA